MKFVCEKEKILRAINSVTKAVATKTTMPILEGILIQTNDKEVKFTTYDLEIGIEYIIDANVEEQGNTVVNAVMFSEIIRRLPDSDINIFINDNNLLVIECEGSLYKLATMAADEFPELPQISVENSIEIEQNTLKDMIRDVNLTLAPEDVLSGVPLKYDTRLTLAVSTPELKLAHETVQTIKNTMDKTMENALDNKRERKMSMTMA